MENLIEHIISKEIFKKPVLLLVEKTEACDLCKGHKIITVEKKYKVPCPKCNATGLENKKEKTEEKGMIQYATISFEENKERIIHLSATYYKNDFPINISITENDVIKFVEEETKNETTD